MADELEITESSKLKVNIAAIIFVIGICCSAAAWMTSIEIKSVAARDDIEQIKQDNYMVQTTLVSIDKRLSRIEILLEKMAKETK